MEYNKEKLLQTLKGYCGEDFDTSPDIANAMELFKQIKKCERTNPDGEKDYRGELLLAQGDLMLIFGVEPRDFRKLTKNQLYMFHQSKMVNAIYDLLKGEE